MNETSSHLLQNKINRSPESFEPKGAIIETIDKGSIAEEIGCEPGDKLIKINGIKPRDVIDYRYMIIEDSLSLEIEDKNGKTHCLDIEKEVDEGLGMNFSEALFDYLHQCNNQCPFCFIDQQPKGHRKSLYLKDDDYRMSFLYGSYLTLTNLKQEDWERIKEQRLSPLFISVHSTNPTIRKKLLRNNHAGNIIEQIKWFSENRLQINAQIVVCPGINDGLDLENTLNDLFIFGQGDWPTIISTAVVPVGLTKFRPLNDGLHPVNKQCAENTIKQVELLQKSFLEESGSRFAWLSDEWYLLAEKEIPTTETYENFPQEENGVGSIKSFLKDIDNATKKLPLRIERPRSCSWVVGSLVKHTLEDTIDNLNKIEGLSVRLYGLDSPYWGKEKVVTGLLTGVDLIKGLTNKDLGDQLLLPSIMFKYGENVFLDDLTIENVSEALKVEIKIVHGANEIISSILGLL